jgi:hypothetical protein
MSRTPGTVSLKVLQLEFGLHQAGLHYAELDLNPVFPNLSGTKNSDTHEMQGVSSSPNRGQKLEMIVSNCGSCQTHIPALTTFQKM